MIKERMLKFLILTEFKNKVIPIDPVVYDKRKLLKDWLKLKKEFLSEYTRTNPIVKVLGRFVIHFLKLTNMRIDEDFLIMENYKLSPNELYLIHALLAYEDDSAYVIKYLTLAKEIGIDIRSLLINLQSKGLILKTYRIPEPGTPFKPEEVQFNQNFVKKYHRASFDLGKELFDVYPQFATINGVLTPIRAVSKKFDSLEDFFRFYGKTIRNNQDLHNHIIELTKWAVDNTNFINCTLANYVIDQKWNDIEALRNGDQGNINFDTVKML